MIKNLFTTCLLFTCLSAVAQDIDKDLLRIKKRMDSVQHFTADVQLDLEVPFINMPTKNASMRYTEGEDIAIASDDFMMLPKRGLDFSLSEIFKYPFITVNRGTEERNGNTLKVLNIIPDDEKSNLALATLYLDTISKRIDSSKITTKKEGSYALKMEYNGQDDILPAYVEVVFAIEKLKIPLNFMGSDTDIDRKKMRKMDTKTGKIKLKIDYTKIEYKD
ncbi:MAG TPA: hypothetical protein ENH91_01525 [Leeuwenhoekiella sp.]|nr:hypothetical protein [Leeuwenhoekiella sp.]